MPSQHSTPDVGVYRELVSRLGKLISDGHMTPGFEPGTFDSPDDATPVTDELFLRRDGDRPLYRLIDGATGDVERVSTYLGHTWWTRRLAIQRHDDEDDPTVYDEDDGPQAGTAALDDLEFEPGADLLDYDIAEAFAEYEGAQRIPDPIRLAEAQRQAGPASILDEVIASLATTTIEARACRDLESITSEELAAMPRPHRAAVEAVRHAVQVDESPMAEVQARMLAFDAEHNSGDGMALIGRLAGLPVPRLDALAAWRRDRMAELFMTAATDAAQHLRDGEEVAAVELARRACDQITAIPTARVRALPKFTADMLAPLGKRMATGFPTLDHGTGGGFPAGTYVALVGAPGSGKTGVVMQWADQWERDGAFVAFLSADQWPRAMYTRLGQRIGIPRELLEAEGPASDNVRRKLEEHLADRRIYILDGDVWTLEEAAESIRAAAGEAPCVLIVDLVQTVQLRDAVPMETARARVDAVVAAMRRVKNRGVTVVGLSEANRASYASGAAAKDADPLGAGKDSGSIESRADVQLFFRTPANESQHIDAAVGKNRLARDHLGKAPFRLLWDFARAEATEIGLPPPEEARERLEDARMARHSARASKDAEGLLEWLSAQMGPVSGRDMASAMAARGMSRARVEAARHLLKERGAVECADGGRRAVLWTVAGTD